MQPPELRRVHDHWTAWCQSEGRDALWLSPEAGEAYLAHLLETEIGRSAYARFATFQIAASLAWGPESSGHLALTLRASRVKKKEAPADRWKRAEQVVARLPASWQKPFRNLLETSRDAPGTRGVLVWSAARIEAVASALTRFDAFAALTGVRPVPTAGLCQAWAEFSPRRRRPSASPAISRASSTASSGC